MSDAVSLGGRTCAANDNYGQVMQLPVMDLTTMSKVLVCSCCGHKCNEETPFEGEAAHLMFGGYWPWHR
eukprot:1455343-Pyramimonas_sp.AAC.1